MLHSKRSGSDAKEEEEEEDNFFDGERRKVWCRSNLGVATMESREIKEQKKRTDGGDDDEEEDDGNTGSEELGRPFLLLALLQESLGLDPRHSYKSYVCMHVSVQRERERERERRKEGTK